LPSRIPNLKRYFTIIYYLFLSPKIVLLGESGVGKTTVVLRYINGNFSRTTPTISASFWTKKLVVNNTKITLQIWDTAGQERFKSMTSIYYRNAQAAILVLDVTDPKSFESVQYWVNELRSNAEDVFITIAVNKIDIQNHKLDKTLVSEYAANIGAPLFYTSAKENRGIEDIFDAIIKELMKKKKFN